MSTLKVNNLQVGQHATATNNFTLYQPAVPDGTVRLGYGNVGGVTDSLTLTNTGRLGIGVTNPDSLLHLKSTTGNVRHTIEVPDTFQAFTNYSAANSEFSIGYIRNSGSDHSFRFCAADGLSSNEIMRIDSVSGNIGIGTTNPGTSRLDVVSNSASGYIAEFNQSNTSNSAQLLINSPTNGESRPVLIDMARAGILQWSIGQAYLDTNNSFHIATSTLQSGNTGSRLCIRTNGNVGIGTTNPSTKLHIFASGGDTGEIRLQSSDGKTYAIGSTGSGYGSTNNFIVYDITASAERFRINSSGNVGIGSTNPSYKLDVSGVAGASTFISTSYSVFGSIVAADPGSNYYSWNNRIGSGLAVVGTTFLDGNVGIGTTNPSTKLHVHNGEFSLKSAAAVFPALFKATSKEFSNISTTYVSFDHSINVGGNSGFAMVSIETVGDHQASFMFTTGRQNAIAHKYTHFAPVCCSVTEVSEGTFDIVIDGDARTYTLQFSVSALSIAPNFKANSATSGITTVAILFFQFPAI